jgi:hypothetical protein
MSDFLSRFLADDIEKKVRTTAPSGVGGSSRRSTHPNMLVSHVASVPLPMGILVDDTIVVEYVLRRKGPVQSCRVPRLHITATTFAHQSAILYGGSGTGKTTCVKHILHKMKRTFPIVNIFCPTNSSHGDYNDMVPPNLIHTAFDLARLTSLYKRQEMAVHSRKTGQDSRVLEGIIRRIMNPVIREEVAHLRGRQEKDIAQAQQMPEGTRGPRLRALKGIHEKELSEYYRGQVCRNLRRLQTFQDYTVRELMAIQYRNFISDTLCVFDDTITEIKQLIQQGRTERNDVVTNFFFRGRHCDITHFYCFQDDKGLDSGIRKNAFRSIFTSRHLANTYFTRQANGFSKEEQAEAKAVIETVLHDDNDQGKNYKKLVYSRDSPQRWTYMVAEVHDEVRMCNDAVWKYYEMSSKGDQALDQTNPYFSKFLPAGVLAPRVPYSQRGYSPST